MQVRFLLGPAGSGKTFRCLQEIRAELLAANTGPDLILLAPKQATFQLERQLLADPTLPGYTRVRILSFERLAQFVLDTLRLAPPPSVNEQGRVMVLRALLLRRAEELKSFHKSARRPGFAQQLSQLLGELRRHQLTPARLRALARRPALAAELRNKLDDLALLLEAYEGWLGEQALQDGDGLLKAATEALREKKAESRKQKAESQNETPYFDFADFSVQRCQPTLNLSALWLDGFAEMTPVEVDLLAAVLPRCERVTLAFCLEESAAGEAAAGTSWLSIWATVRKTYLECRRRAEALTERQITVEQLQRGPQRGRFAASAELAHLEAAWASPAPTVGGMVLPDEMESQAVSKLGRDELHESPLVREAPEESGARVTRPCDVFRMVVCADPDAEATCAAREILRFVRRGGRFRDAAVLVRNLEGYHKPLERAFRRYEIPFFLDRREGAAHHPLAELTRSALRTVAFDWQHEDWFAALKSGFAPADETEIDRLENESLARGWRGAKWRSPGGISNGGIGTDPARGSQAGSVERLRQNLVAPFAELAQRLVLRENRPTGAQLAEALRALWEQLGVEPTLEQWSLAESHRVEPTPYASQEGNSANPQSAIHLTVWEQMNDWLDNLELAFSRESLPLREWLPILEAGLANLTVGVVPPALDQVLIGAIDRSRNPELKLALVLGFNEGVFPARPAAPDLLTDADRDALVTYGAALGPDLRERLGRERYLGYIACTRASQKLVVTYARRDADGKVLNPSPFVSHLKRLCPEINEEEFHGSGNVVEAEHACELVGTLLAHRSTPDLSEEASGARPIVLLPGGVKGGWHNLPALQPLVESLLPLRHPDPAERLAPALAERLFGPVLRTSVSRLEQFAACPFRFFIHSGLRAEERKLFELDPREQGSFQHEALKVFHEQLRTEGKRWRDVTPREARERMERIAAALKADYREGLLCDRERSRFTAQMLAESLQDFVEVLVGWMREQYDFEPAAVELEFGGASGGLPGWEIDLGAGHRLVLRGRIDRVDLWREPGTDRALCVVMDYKSSHKQLDPLLMQHGVQLQLLGYLSVLRHCLNPNPLFDVARLTPVGAFYVNLRGKYERGRSRTEVLADADARRKRAYRHAGRFDASVLRRLDRRLNVSQGDQFNYRLNKSGALRANSTEALDPAAFGILLENIESQLAAMGARILAGDAAVDPYRKNGITPCEQCDYRAICRIDPWTHRYRILPKEQSGPD